MDDRLKPRKKVLTLEEELRPPTLDKIAAFLNQLTADECADIYLCTIGGNMHVVEAIISLLDHWFDNKISLVGYGTLYSGGFDIFFRTNINKVLLPLTVGMFHQASTSIPMNEDNTRTFHEGDMLVVQAKAVQQLRTSLYFDWLEITPKEKKKYKQGKDVYCTSTRMTEFLQLDHNKRLIANRTRVEDLFNIKSKLPQ